MAFANTSISDLIAVGIDSRNREIADNALNHTPITAALKAKGRVKTFSGGITILEELNYNNNANGGSYSGYDVLPVAASDNISAAQFNIKQYAVPVTVSGLEARIQNAGKEALLDLVEERITVAEDTMANLLETDVYGDGTGNGGKALTGLAAAVEATATASQTSTYGGISRTNFAFWRNQYSNPATNTSATLQAAWNTMWSSCTRGNDQPDVIIAGNAQWGRYLASLQAIQRFTDPSTATLGFATLKYMTADVFLGGGINGVVATGTTLFLNTKFLRWRPHSATNMITLPDRFATNQDAFTRILLWAGNLTCRGAQFQGRLVSSD